MHYFNVHLSRVKIKPLVEREYYHFGSSGTEFELLKGSVFGQIVSLL
jgi:hypothetical protein